MLDPKRVSKIIMVCKISHKELLYQYFAWISYGSDLERFQFVLVKRASVHMVPSVRHFENYTLWIQLRLGLRDRA